MNGTLADYVVVFEDSVGEFRYRAMSADHREISRSSEGYAGLDRAIAQVRELYPGTRIALSRQRLDDDAA